MTVETPTQIVIIDDNFRENDPLMVALQDKYGVDNVKIERQPSEGVAYVLKNQSNKIVVLLDFYFGANQNTGDYFLEEIRGATSLVTVIIMSANLPNLPNEVLHKFINHSAFSTILHSNDSVKANLPIIENAVGQLSLRVDCALEEWILRHSPDDRDKPFLTMRTGEKFSLNQILTEIRKGNQSEIGIFFQKSILKMAVELLARQKEQL